MMCSFFKYWLSADKLIHVSIEMLHGCCLSTLSGSLSFPFHGERQTV
jgi:hypothetical protein